VTTGGDLVIDRPDGRVATLCRPGQPDRQVSLMRRPMAELLAEELRRLDPDEVYRDAAARFAKDLAGGTQKPGVASEPVSATSDAAAPPRKQATAKRAGAGQADSKQADSKQPARKGRGRTGDA
ncbi:OpcA/G6PD domain-containing protein, partial [Actinomadura sp. NPDC048032]